MQTERILTVPRDSKKFKRLWKSKTIGFDFNITMTKNRKMLKETFLVFKTVYVPDFIGEIKYGEAKVEIEF